MTNYLYTVHNVRLPAWVQRDQILNLLHPRKIEIKRVFTDRQEELSVDFLNRTEGRMLATICKEGDIIYVWDWMFIVCMTSKIQKGFNRFMENRGALVYDRYLEPRQTRRDELHRRARHRLIDLINYTGTEYRPSRAKKQVQRHKNPGWTRADKHKTLKPDVMARIYARMLLTLVTEYGFSIEDIGRVRRKNTRFMVGAAMHGFPRDRANDFISGITPLARMAYRITSEAILRAIGNRTITHRQLINTLHSQKAPYPKDIRTTLFDLRCSGLIVKRWDKLANAYLYEQVRTISGGHHKVSPYDILKSIEGNNKSIGELVQEHHEPRWYLRDVLHAKSVRKSVNVTRDKKGKLHYRLACPVDKVNLQSLKDDAALTASYSSAYHTSLSRAHEDESVPLDPYGTSGSSSRPGGIRDGPFHLRDHQPKLPASEASPSPDD